MCSSVSGWGQRLQFSKPSHEGQLVISVEQYKFLELMYYLNNFYVDSVGSETKYVERAIEAVLAELDPHSSFISLAERKDVDDAIYGHFEGVGIEFTIRRDSLHVVSVIPDGPSERVGVRPGDVIVRVDGAPISGKELNNRRVRDLLRGPKGTKVRLENVRGGDTLTFIVERDRIPLLSVDVEYVLDSGVGYLRMNRFSLDSYQEMVSALGRMEKRKVKGVILDLRGNGGGVMHPAVDIAGLFLHPGALVVYAQGHAVPRQDFFVDERSRSAWRDKPLVVLVDEYTSSSSEILSGALQDWDRAVIVGRRTYGKGLVQQQIPLMDGSYLRLTVARYYTPSGRIIQTPYKMGDEQEYRDRFRARYTSGELFHADSVKTNDSLLMYTLRSGRPVYGGGGILPDIFVPLDTMEAVRYVNQLDRLGVIATFAMEYAQEHAEPLKTRYPSMRSFADGFVLHEDEYQPIHSELQRMGADSLWRSLDSLSLRERELLDRRIRLYMIRHLYSYADMIRFLNEFSEEVRRGEAIIEEWESEGKRILNGHAE